MTPGVIAGAACAMKSRLFRFPAVMYINIARNTPPLVLLFCVYFFAGNILPINSLEEWLRDAPEIFRSFFTMLFAVPGQMDRMIAAVLALGLYEGAFIAEIIRGGMQSVGKGQWDAAYALGFSPFQTARLIIIPQTVRLILPPLTGQMITTFKETALIALISLPDLTFQSLEIMAITNMTFEIWVTTGIIYLFLGLLCSLFGHFAENKL